MVEQDRRGVAHQVDRPARDQDGAEDADHRIEPAEAEAAAEEAGETIADLMGAGDNPAIEAAVEEEVFEALSDPESAGDGGSESS